MIKGTEDLVKQFREEMKIAVTQFEKDQRKFFNSEVSPYAPNERYETFPEHFYQALFTGSPDVPDVLTDWVIKNTKSVTIEERGKDITLSMKRGDTFEQKAIEYVEQTKLNGDNLLGLLHQKGKLLFDPVGSQHKREDLRLTDEFSLDFKFSTQEGAKKYTNILKKAGNSTYNAIVDIERGIIRSLFSEGAKGLVDIKWKPSKGIFEVKRNGQRQNLLFVYNDECVWASKALEELVELGAQRLAETGWRNALTNKGENFSSFLDEQTGINTHTFMGFWFNSK